jgi:transposase-like protein
MTMNTEKRTARVFTPKQKFEILKDIEKQESVKAGLEKYQLSSSTYSKWRRPSIGWPRARHDSGNTSAERTQLLIEYQVAPDFAASRPFSKRWLISPVETHPCLERSQTERITNSKLL